VLRRLRAGAGPAAALALVLAELAEHQLTGRFNFLLTDGEVIAATAAGDTLCYRSAGGATVVASEPGDDEPGWTDVPDGSVLTATASTVELSSLPAMLAGHR
jgi:glutamine amidotransferase